MPTIAFLGVAHIHTPGFINMLGRRANWTVKYVVDHHAQRAKIRADELSAKVVSVEQAAADPDVSGFVVCSETHLHEQIVAMAVKAGKPLFVEKPLGMAAADAYRMADMIEKAGVPFQTGYFRRSDPKIRFLQEKIAAGKLGTITRIRGSNCHNGSLGGWFDDKADISTNWRWMADVKQAGCGAFGDLGTHMLDLLILLCGPVKHVTAQIDPVTARYGKDCDETGEALLRFESGAIGTLAAGWVDHADPVSLLVSGTEGHAAIIDNKLHLTSKTEPVFDGTAAIRNSELPPALPHAFELFLDKIEGKNVTLVGAKEAAYRNAVMEAMYAAAKEGKWVTPSKA